jgi:hypothetical protein
MDPYVDDLERDDLELPSLPRRLLYVFVSPAKLNEHLAESPKWFFALVVSVGLISVSAALIPFDVFVETWRRAALERGQDFPELPQRALTLMRWGIPLGAFVSSTIMFFLISGFYTLVFAFLLGDQGRFRQYLAVLAHAWFIAAFAGLLMTPLRISQGDPQLTLNVASFFFFLPDGYLLNVFRALDLTQIWSTLVFAQGAHAIDERRSFVSAAAIALTVVVGLALIAARFM